MEKADNCCVKWMQKVIMHNNWQTPPNLRFVCPRVKEKLNYGDKKLSNPKLS